VPRFFDTKNAVDLSGSKLRILSGFKASAFQSQVGCTLVVDSIFKFMSTNSCLSRMIELRDDYPQQSVHQWQQRCKMEFCEKSVIADWGNQRQYIVTDVVFDTNPIQETFDHQGKETSVAEYFLRTYNKRITQPKQPMFLVKVAEKEFHLPTEFCLIDGVPDSVRKGPGMRDALAQTRIDPVEKIRRIQDMVKTLMSQKAMQDWNIVVEQDPIQMQTSVLGAPQMISGRQIIKCDEQALRRQSIAKPTDLLNQEWIMVYENSDRVYSIADNIYRDLCKASGQLKLRVEEPYWIELSKESNRDELD